MIPKELFHYTKKDIALEKILFERKIKLGQICFTNDPKETKRLQVSFSHSNSDKWNHTKVNNVFGEIERVFKEEWNVLCMTKTLPQRKYKETERHFVMGQSRYGYAHPKMWAHYGDNHSGVCIIFDGKKLNSNIQLALRGKCRIFSGSVDYKTYAVTYKHSIDSSYIDKYGLSDGVREYFFKNYKGFFLTKHPDWASESEFRWILHNTTKSPEFVSIDGAIKSILVGSEFPLAYEILIKELCKELSIPVGRIMWMNGMPFPSFGSIYSPKS